MIGLQNCVTRPGSDSLLLIFLKSAQVLYFENTRFWQKLQKQKNNQPSKQKHPGSGSLSPGGVEGWASESTRELARHQSKPCRSFKQTEIWRHGSIYLLQRRERASSMGSPQDALPASLLLVARESLFLSSHRHCLSSCCSTTLLRYKLDRWPVCGRSRYCPHRFLHR